MESKPDEPGSASASATRLIVFYVALAVLTAVVSFVVIKNGRREAAAGDRRRLRRVGAQPVSGRAGEARKAVTLPSTAPAQAPPSGPSFDL